MGKKSMTLLEIVISILILSFVGIGIANVFIASKKHINLNRSKIVAAELGRYYVDILQVNVTQANWDQIGNDLYAKTYTPFNRTINQNMNYTITRKVDLIPDSGGGENQYLRRVALTIFWNETSQ